VSARGPLREWRVMEIFAMNDVVSDFRETAEGEHTEPGGYFRSLADQRSGYLNPRYVVLDRPGEFWERIE
jgi:hypothetical protein